MDPPSAKRRRVNASQPDGDVERSSESGNDVISSASPRRATYTAPTRASIARHNPGLLAGQDMLVTGDIRTDHAASSIRVPPRSLNPTALRPKMTAPRLSASPTRETSSSPSRRVRNSHGSVVVRNSLNKSTNTQTVPTAGEDSQEEMESQDEPNQERSLMEEENLAASVNRRSKSGRAVQSGLVMNTNVIEPDLPPTPVQLGLQDRPRRPSGILSSSPHGIKTSGRKPMLKSSPLKPRAEPSNVVASGIPTETGKGAPDDPKTNEQVAPDTAIEEIDDVEEDPEIQERTHRLDQFQRQLQVLRSEVAFLQSQVLDSQDNPDEGIPSAKLTRLVNVLTTNSQADQNEASPLKPTSFATRLSTFLPFAKRPQPLPQDPLLQEEILPSYKPVEGPEPMENFQAFSEFSVASSQQLVIAQTDGGALLNQQYFRLSASSSIDLEIDLVLVSDTDTESIEQLVVQSMTPWAEPELGTWMRRQAEDTADMAVVGWGASRYIKLAKTRASCWRRCSDEFSQYMTNQSIVSEQLSAGAYDGSDDERLTPFLGLISLQLQSSTTRAKLQITWHVDLDWIGDAESRTSAAAIFPSKWRERDSQRNSLSKIPETFQLLVTKVGVFEAIKVLVNLVLGQ